MGEKSLDLFRGYTWFAESLILKLLSDMPGFMGDSMEIIFTDKHAECRRVGSSE